MSLTYRVSYVEADGSAGTVVVKLAANNDNSRNTGVGMGAYLREVAFYQHFGDRLEGPPRCHLAEYDPAEGWFTLVLDDVAGAQQGDQIAGCSVATARLVMQTLAGLHAPVFNDLATGTLDFLNQPNPLSQAVITAVLPQLLERYGERIDAAHAEVCRRYSAVADAHAADIRAPLGLIHGDFRLDNLLFGGDTQCTVVDWQTVQWGPAMVDVAYFLGGSLEIEDRRAHESELVRSYYDRLIAAGVTNFTWEQCWDEYRRQPFWALAVAVVAPMVVERTSRGDEMFMALLRRTCQQIIDLGSLELLPEPGAAPAALRPAPADEGPHQAAVAPFWNESWYFDGVGLGPQGPDVGVYVRLGNVPNQQGGVYSVAVVRPGRPTVMVTDYCCPHPFLDNDRQTVGGTDYHAVHQCFRQLEEFGLRFDGAARQYADDADPLNGTPGDPVQLHLELRWLTDGAPYQWRATTRYEIPCRVEGTIVIDGEEITIAGPGQRDHSWGSRDWWANDWMWTAFHLDDGTRVHAVTLPDHPGMAIGYIQSDGQVLEELTTGSSTAEPTADGLVTAAHMTLGSGPLEVDVQPLGFGALRMQAPDCRVSFFPRAMAMFRTGDGRSGVGWIEWNKNQH
ncbi:MAG: phosphotransferase [Mycobacterium sp.]|nr:MAG: phosphotransferase [Mycobacterium sp.]